MSVTPHSTLLLRGGHRWDCAVADAHIVLTYLSSPSPDQHRVFSLRGADGQTLTVPAREIVGVLDSGQAAAAPPPIPQIAALRKESGLPGSPYLLVDEFLTSSWPDRLFVPGRMLVYSMVGCGSSGVGFRL